MEKIKEIYGELDRLLDELEKVEYDTRAVAYIMEQMQESIPKTGSGLGMVFVWLKLYLQRVNHRLREILDEMDDSVMGLNKML